MNYIQSNLSDIQGDQLLNGVLLFYQLFIIFPFEGTNYQMQSILKNQLSSLPKITLKQLVKQSMNNTKFNSLQNHSQLRSSNKKINNGLISVQEPFYIDRYKKYIHNQCHQEGKCLACGYALLKPFQIINKKHLPLTGRENHVTRTQRGSKINLFSPIKNLKTEQSYQQQMNALTNYIKNEIKKINKKTRQKFTMITKRRCSQNEIIALCAQFLIGSKQNVDQSNFNFHEEKKINLKQVRNKISRYSIQKLITDAGFIKYVLQYNPPPILIEKKRTKGNKRCSIQNIELQDKGASVIHSTERKPKDQRRGIILQDLDCLADSIDSSTKILCTKYFIDQNIALDQQIKQKLGEIAVKSNHQFKAALQAIYDFLQKMNHSENVNQKTVQKLQIAVQLIKQKIPKKDKNKKSKIAELDYLLGVVRNLVDVSKRKKSLKKGSNNTVPLTSRVTNLGDNKNVGTNLSNFSRGKAKRKENVKKLQDTPEKRKGNQQKQIPVFQNKNQAQKSINVKIEEGSRDESSHEQQVQSRHNNSTKSSENKLQLRRATFSQNPFKSKVPQMQDENRRSLRSNQRLMVKQKGRDNQDENILDTDIKKITEASEVSDKKTDKIQDEEQVTMEAIQKRNKALLRIKAAELIKQNQQLIKNTERALRSLNLNRYVINQNDCLLTQKKKVRHLREILRHRMQNGQISEDLINQILQYLSIFQDNFFFMIQKTPDAYGNEFSIGTKFDFRKIVNKKQIYKDLNFYHLNDDFIFGQAEQEELNFTLKGPRFDKSWEIMSLKNLDKKMKRDIIQIQYIQKQKPQFDDLIQSGLPYTGKSKLYGIAKVFQNSFSKKEQQNGCQVTKRQQKLLLTQNE